MVRRQFALVLPHRSVGDWDGGVPLDTAAGAMRFSPSSDLLAAETETGAVQCFEPETGRKIVRLEEPNQNRMSWLAFTPDGTRLVATSQDSRSVHVRDLRLIRKKLGDLGLDWDAAPYDEAGDPDDGPKPRLRVAVDVVRKK
jgi:hypothetical protein